MTSEGDPVQRDVIAVVLGIAPPFSLFGAGVTNAELSKILREMFSDSEPPSDEAFHARLQELVQLNDAGFDISSSSSEQIALSLIEDECLVLIGGTGRPDRLFVALRRADKLFRKPAWVGAFFRSVYSLPEAKFDKLPPLADELRALVSRVHSAQMSQ